MNQHLHTTTCCNLHSKIEGVGIAASVPKAHNIDDAAVLLIDHQAGLLSLVQDYSPDEFRNNVLALADTALLVHAAGVNAWWLMPLCVIAALGWSLRRATSGGS